MISLIKRLLPDYLVDILRLIKQRTYDTGRYQYLLKAMPKKHQALINSLQGKVTLRVAFLVSEKSKWKVDEIFKLMQRDSTFSPFIVVVPYHRWEAEVQKEKVRDFASYLRSKECEVYSHFKENKKISEELASADLVFFSDPYDVARNKVYYSDLFKNKLCFYVPYFFMATTHVKSSSLKFNGIYYPFLLSMWKIYWPHDEIKNELEAFDIEASKNSQVCGYPSMEYLHQQTLNKVEALSAWKEQAQDKIKIIYAPHHSIFENDPARETLATFIHNGEKIKELSIKYKEKVAWSFKPHPLLIHHLYQHPDWGKERADAYYRFWQEQEYTQFDDGVYDDLFLQSNAIIHDCSSFIVEYAFTQKPCLYLVSGNHINDYLNEFGKGVIGVYKQAKTVKEIEQFIQGLLTNPQSVQGKNTVFFNQYVEKYYNDQLPSERIIEDIKQSLGYINDK